MFCGRKRGQQRKMKKKRGKSKSTLNIFFRMKSTTFNLGTKEIPRVKKNVKLPAGVKSFYIDCSSAKHQVACRFGEDNSRLNVSNCVTSTTNGNKWRFSIFGRVKRRAIRVCVTAEAVEPILIYDTRKQSNKLLNDLDYRISVHFTLFCIISAERCCCRSFIFLL